MFFLIYLTNLFYRHNKKELTNVEIQEQTGFFEDDEDGK